MKKSRYLTLAPIALLLPMLTGCGHKLVARGDEHTVRVFPNENTYEKVKDLKKEGGPAGMLGGLGENMVAKALDNNTPVRIISSDSEGAQIEVTDGPSKGTQGFVAKENVD